MKINFTCVFAAICIEIGASMASVASNDDKALSLLDLINIGLSNNPSVKNAWWAAKYAEAQNGMSKSSMYPSLTLGAKALKSQDGATSASSTRITEAVGPYASLTYKLFQFGADKVAVDSTISLLNAANFNHSHAIQKNVFDIEKSYYEFCTANELINARKSNLNDAEVSFNAVSKKQESGLARIQDLLRAKSDKLQAEYELSSANSNFEAKRVALAITVGELVSQDFVVKTNFDVAVDENFLNDVNNLIDEAIKSRPDLLASLETMHSNEFELKSAEKSSLPEVQIGITGDLLKIKHSSKVKRDFSANVAVQWQAFDGFYKEHKALAAYSKLKMQTEAHKAKMLSVAGQVWTSFHALKSSLDGLSSASALKDAATEALSAVRTGYDAGVNSLVDLLNAQNTLSSARLSLVQAKANVAVNLAELTYSCGKTK